MNRRATRAALFLVVLLSLLTCTCNIPQPALTPAGTVPRPTPPPATYTPLASAIVGAAGGTLEAAGFSLTVPAGALAAETQLRLSADAGDRPFGDNGASPVYRVVGLPRACARPLSVRLQYDGTLSGESFIAAGTPALDPDQNVTDTAYRLSPATEAGGYLEGTVPACTAAAEGLRPAAAGLSAPAAQDQDVLEYLDLLAVMDEATDTRTHFVIRYPRYMQDNVVPALGDALEEALQVFKDMGFQYAPSLPRVDVVIRDLTGAWAEDYARFVLTDSSQGPQPELAFNTRKLIAGNVERLRTETARVVFPVVALHYDADDFANPADNWFHAAVAEWAGEKLASRSQDYRPPHLAGNELAPFRGMQADAAVGKRHARGMAPVVKYIVGRHGEAALVGIYDEIKRGSTPTAAVIKVMSTEFGRPSFEWWPDFFELYFQSDLYGLYGVSSETLLSEVTEVIDLSASRASQTVSAEYPDLSAQVYRVDLRDADSGANVQVHLTASSAQLRPDEAQLVAFWYKDGKLYDPVSGKDVQAKDTPAHLAAGFRQLVVVVVDSGALPPDYTHRATVSLLAEINPEVGYNWGHVGFTDLNLTFEKAQPLARLARLAQQFTTGTALSYYWEGAGRMKGNQFMAAWDQSFGDMQHAGTLTITLDAGLTRIVGFDASETLDGVNQFGYLVHGKVAIRDAGRPLTRGVGLHATGTDACTWFAGLIWEGTTQLPPSGPLDATRLKSWECLDDSEFDIYLEKR